MSARRLFALALLLFAAGPAAAGQVTVQLTTTVLRSDPGIEIVPPAVETFTTGPAGAFTFPVFRLIADDGPPAFDEATPDQTVIDKVRSVQVRFDLAVPAVGWSGSVTVEGVTSYVYQFRAPPQEGFGWRTVEQFEGLDFLGNPDDPSQITVNGVRFRREQAFDPKPGYDIAVTGLPTSVDTPEPTTLLLAGFGLGALALRRRR